MNITLTPRVRLTLLLVALLGVAAVASIGLRHGLAQSVQPVLTPAFFAEARVDVSSLNLRTGPHVSYTAVAYLMDGEAVHLVGRNRAGTWAQVELYNGYRGWVNARYLQPGVNLLALPVADVPLLGITAFVTNDPIAVYAGPGAFYQRVGTANPGDTLTLNGRDDATTWVHVYLPDGRAGWVAATSPWLPSSALNDLPIITPFLDAPLPELAAYYLVYTGPGFLYEAVDSLVEGQSLGLRGRTADARWVLVQLANGREGWIAAEIIQMTVPLEAIPVIEGIAPPQGVGWQVSGAAPATTATALPPATATEAATQAATPAETTAPTVEPSPTSAATATAGAGGKNPVLPVGTPTGDGAAATPTDAPTTTPAPTRTLVPTPTAAPTEAASPAPQATATDQPPAATETATAIPATATSAPAAGDGSATPAVPVVYVYATPSEDNSPILRVVPGQSVVLVGRTADSQWVQIWLPGDQQGWIRASAIQVEIDLSILPVVEP